MARRQKLTWPACIMMWLFIMKLTASPRVGSISAKRPSMGFGAENTDAGTSGRIPMTVSYRSFMNGSTSPLSG